MHITIITGPLKRHVQLRRILSVFFTVLVITSCALQPTANWDPVQPDSESTTTGLNRSTLTMSPAMATLIQQADEAIDQQQWSMASSILERALRVNAKQPEAWTRMAVVYLGKNNPEQCIHMATKSNRHAKDNRQLQAYNWLLMSRAYQQLGDALQAEVAMIKSRQLQEGR